MSELILNPIYQVDSYVIKSGELDFKPVTDYAGKLKTGTVGPWACEMYECTGDMQLQAFRKGAGDNLLRGLTMKVWCGAGQCGAGQCGANIFSRQRS